MHIFAIEHFKTGDFVLVSPGDVSETVYLNMCCSLHSSGQSQSSAAQLGKRVHFPSCLALGSCVLAKHFMSQCHGQLLPGWREPLAKRPLCPDHVWQGQVCPCLIQPSSLAVGSSGHSAARKRCLCAFGNYSGLSTLDLILLLDVASFCHFSSDVIWCRASREHFGRKPWAELCVQFTLREHSASTVLCM